MTGTGFAIGDQCYRSRSRFVTARLEDSVLMIDDFAKKHLHEDLKWTRSVLVHKIDGLSEYDIRRPLTPTGTNLLGLIKHVTLWESRYFGEVFDRPLPEGVLPWDDFATNRASLWVTAGETRDQILERYEQVCRHSDSTIAALSIDATGYVPWWPRPSVTLFNVMVHMLTETTRHTGHADILREQLDGAVGDDPSPPAKDSTYLHELCSQIDQAAQTAQSNVENRPYG